MATKFRFIAVASLCWMFMGLAVYPSDAQIVAPRVERHAQADLSGAPPAEEKRGTSYIAGAGRGGRQDPMIGLTGVENVSLYLSPVVINERMNSSALPAEGRKTKGLKSLFLGSILFAILAFSLISVLMDDDSASDEESLGMKTLKYVDHLNDSLAEYLSPFKLRSPLRFLFMGAGPALLVSGLVGLLASLGFRSAGRGRTLMLRGILLVVLACLILSFLSRVGEDEEARENFGPILRLGEELALGVGIMGFLTVLTGFGQWLFRRPKPKTPLGNPHSGSFPDL